ncbi:MAG: hypothetical protein AAFQ94_04455 [Bacteroidota bacterium]
MKAYFVLLSFFILFSLSANSQESKRYRRLKDHTDYSEGYVTLKNGERIEGLIHYFKSGFYSVILVDKQGRKLKYTPDDLKDYYNSRYTFVSGVTSKRQSLFFRLVPAVSGDLQLYETIYEFGGFSSDYGSNAAIERANVPFSRVDDDDNGFVYHVKKSGDQFYYMLERLLRRPKKAAEYFTGCPEFIKKVEQDEFRELDPSDRTEIIKIVNSYNACVDGSK